MEEAKKKRLVNLGVRRENADLLSQQIAAWVLVY